MASPALEPCGTTLGTNQPRSKAELKWATEARDFLKKRLLTSFISAADVGLHGQAAVYLQRAAHVLGAGTAPQR